MAEAEATTPVRTRHILQSSLIVIALFGLGKLTGLLRTRLVGNAFGTSPAYDAFTAANQLPEVFFVLIAGGSLAAAFIPVYSNYLVNKSRQQSLRLANTVLTLVFILLVLVAAFAAAIAPWLTRQILVPSFLPETQLLTASIMRVILIQTIIFGVSGVFSSILNAHQHFALPALAPIMLDAGYFIGLFFFVPEIGIIGLAWGTVVGGLLHLLVQTPALVRYGYRYRPALDLALPGVQEIIRLMGPRVVTLGTIQVADLFIIRIASGLATGSTSAYFYAYALFQFPETLIGTAIALVVFPTLSELFNAGNMAALKRTAVRTLGIMWTLSFPAAAALVLLGQPAIAVLLQGGQFDARSTRLVYAVLIAFSVRVVSESTIELVARLFYAQHNTRTPMFAYLGWLAVSIFTAYLLVDRFGITGLALSSTIAFTALAAALLALNWRRLGGLDGRYLAASAGRAVAATAVMSLVILAVGRLVTGTLLYLLAGAAAGGATYLALYLLLGGRELGTLWRLLRSRPA